MKRVKIESKFQATPLWKRFFSYVVDIFLINLILSIPFAGYFESRFGGVRDVFFGGKSNGGLLIVSFLILFLILFYFVIMEYKTGQTIGSMIFGIYAISLIGKNMAFGQAFIRNILMPFPIVLLIDSLYMIFKGGNRRLFEVFSATAVVEKGVVLK